MTRIRIDTGQVDDAGRRLTSEGAFISNTGQRLTRLIDGLDWEGRQRLGMEQKFAAVRPRAESLSQQADELGRRLMRIAAAFEKADSETAQELSGLLRMDFEMGSPVHSGGWAGSDLDSLPHWVSGFAGDFDDIKDVIEILASVWLAGGLVIGSTYAGQAIFYGGRRLKDWAGVNPYLTHIKDANIPSHMAQNAFKITKGGILLEGLGEVDENWKEYERDVPKVATGVVVDTLIGVGVSAVFAAGGAAAGAALGLVALGPAGAVIGGKIGRVLGSMAGGWAAEKIEDIKIGDRELDQAVVETVTGGIQAGVQAVDKALDSFVDGVAQLF